MNDPTAKRWHDMMRSLAAGVTGASATATARAALLDAMKRKESYSASGPRIFGLTGGSRDVSADFTLDK